MRITYVVLGSTSFHSQGGVGDKIDAQRTWPRNFGYEECLFFLTPDQLSFDSSTARLPLLKNTTRFISRSIAVARELSRLTTEKLAWLKENSHKTTQELNAETDTKQGWQVVQDLMEIKL